jgi:hypothetical protein
MSDKLKNIWKQIKSVHTFKANDPTNKQNRVSLLDKDFYKKPIGRSNKVTGVYPPGHNKKK